MGGTGGSDAGAGCSGKPGAPGNRTRTWQGLQYIVHSPTTLNPDTPVPLVFVAHGFTMSGALMQSLTGFDAVADRERFVVVYPNGHGAFPWNVGNATCAPGSLVNNATADSFGYFDAMKAAVAADQCIRDDAVFVTGFSMGGYFSNHIGCQRGGSFARAVGPHSGGTYPGACPAAPVPVFVMHGSADTFIDFTVCGQGARNYWLDRNNCGSQSTPRAVQGGTCNWYSGCDSGGETVFCSFTGVGHNWAPGATEAVWGFFEGYL
jgi:poly(3-hydroxybutyrate) depolymerase